MIPEELQKLLDENKWKDAIIFLENIKEPLNDELLEKLGWCFSRDERYNESISIYNKLIEKEPQKALWHYSRGYQFYMQEQWQQAADNFYVALEAYPNYFKVKYRLAYSLLKLSGDYMQWSKDTFWKAIQQLKECHTIYSKFTDKKKQENNSLYADICALHGKTISSSTQHIDEAVSWLQKSLELKSDDDVKYQLAKAYFTKKDYETALVTLPQKSTKYYITELKVDILANSGKLDEAISILLNHIKYRPKDYNYRRVSEIYLQLKQFDNAEKYALIAISKNRDNHKNYYVCGQVYNVKEQNKTAVDYLIKADEVKQKKFNSSFSEALQLKDYILEQSKGSLIDKMPVNVSKQKQKTTKVKLLNMIAIKALVLYKVMILIAVYSFILRNAKII